jgi:DNA-binding LytR/AlgR family response regulator
VAKQTITSLEEMLPEDGFLRIHRSFIVALQKIDIFSPSYVEVAKKELPVGRHYKHDLERMLGNGNNY